MVLPRLVSGVGSLPGLQMYTFLAVSSRCFSSVLMVDVEGSVVSSSFKDARLVGLGPHPYDLI